MLRLVYYDNATKPRIWIRSPGTKKELSNSAADFVPIYSGKSKNKFLRNLIELPGQPNPNVINMLARKLKEAKMFEPINDKLRENRKIMERLSRL